MVGEMERVEVGHLHLDAASFKSSPSLKFLMNTTCIRSGKNWSSPEFLVILLRSLVVIFPERRVSFRVSGLFETAMLKIYKYLVHFCVVDLYVELH